MPPVAATAAASHLPPISWQRGTGLISRGSREKRSRSPAVASVAICMPAVKPAAIRKMGITFRMVAARCWALEISTSSTFRTLATVGLTTVCNQAQTANLAADVGEQGMEMSAKPYCQAWSRSEHRPE
jgi:hypothetical protein